MKISGEKCLFMRTFISCSELNKVSHFSKIIDYRRCSAGMQLEKDVKNMYDEDGRLVITPAHAMACLAWRICRCLHTYLPLNP